jgi:hypothetical protein
LKDVKRHNGREDKVTTSANQQRSVGCGEFERRFFVSAIIIKQQNSYSTDSGVSAI